MASLITSTFDRPNEDNKLASLQWKLFGKSLTDDFTYRQYISTARRMRGKKYCVFIAKDIVDGTVVGMVEMGMSKCPVTTSIAKDSNFGINNTCSTKSSPQPTVGVLCVKSTHQNQGIGYSLLKKCEEVAQEIWKEQNVYVDVEPKNCKALTFFTKYSYEHVLDGQNGPTIRNTTVYRMRVQDVKPHWLLRKSFV
eukprot:scaffold82226_cov70-Cyclotella_meneghiniana.AAC.1